MKNYVIFLGIVFSFLFSECKNNSQPTEKKQTAALPNIVWIMLEDWGYQLSCYGEPGIKTPNIDKLAYEGVRYTNSFTTSPVCSPSRSAMMTGFHQNFIASQQHRTAAKFGFSKKNLPIAIAPLTAHLKNAGYHTALMQSKKTDLNFIHQKNLFDSGDWKNRESGQPFFAQVTFEGTHRKWRRDSIHPISIDAVVVPPYYPQTALVKRDWANGLEAAQIVDRQVGALLERLENEGLKENTIVFLIGDNGRCMPRGKQFLYDGGIQVPLLIRWPGKIAKNSINKELTSTIDITKTILDIAKVKPKTPLHGRNLLDLSLAKRKYIFAARDKMDSTYDASRAIRSINYKLIHNLMPERPYLQYNKYKENYYPTLAAMNVLYLKGELNKNQINFMARTKPEFELYDIKNDPYELNNLANNPNYDAIKNKHLLALNKWRKKVKDQGVDSAFRVGGWPAEYPTKTLKEWETHLEAFKPWVFRKPTEKITHPFARNNYGKKKK
jgi:uncharacterized sulfatase